MSSMRRGEATAGGLSYLEDVADSFVFEELLGCIGEVGRCQIRPEVVPTIAVLFLD